MDLLKSTPSILLNNLKEASGLSNKAWDKSIKSLTQNGLAKVTKENDVLTVILL